MRNSDMAAEADDVVCGWFAGCCCCCCCCVCCVCCVCCGGIGFDTNDVSRDRTVRCCGGGCDCDCAATGMAASVAVVVIETATAPGGGIGGLPGRASCASSELTNPMGGARCERFEAIVAATVVEAVATAFDGGCVEATPVGGDEAAMDAVTADEADDDDDDDVATVVVEFCSSCFSNTFCESSDLTGCVCGVCGALAGAGSSIRVTAIGGASTSIASSLSLTLTSMLCRFSMP